MLGTYGETDVIRNGNGPVDLVQPGAGRRPTAPSTPAAGRTQRQAAGDMPRTPQEAAEQVLAALEPTTTVTTDSAVTVADRPAYELVLDPNDDATLISQIRHGHRRRHQHAAPGADLRRRTTSRSSRSATTRSASPARRTASSTFNAPPGAPRSPRPSRSARASRNKKAREQVREEAKDAREQVKVVGSGWSTVAGREDRGDRGRRRLAGAGGLPQPADAGHGRLGIGPAAGRAPRSPWC